jgi:hypothetical protein
MTDKAISPLRQRMIEDMTIRKLAPKTQHDYVQRVKNFAAFLGRSPARPIPRASETACPRQVRFYPDSGFDDEIRPVSTALTASDPAEWHACTFVYKRYLRKSSQVCSAPTGL